MKTEIEGGCIKVDVYEACEAMGDDALLLLADAVALQPAVIRAVAAQIVGGWTELGSHAARIFGTSKPSGALDEAIREVAKRSGEAAKREIETMEVRLADAEATIARLDAARDRIQKAHGSDWTVNLLREARFKTTNEGSDK